jgi:hypothetical protein
MGAALGCITFAFSAGVYIALHALRGGGTDLNGADEGGSAHVFFLVHIVVGTLVGLAIGAVAAAVAWLMRASGSDNKDLIEEPR